MKLMFGAAEEYMRQNGLPLMLKDGSRLHLGQRGSKHAELGKPQYLGYMTMQEYKDFMQQEYVEPFTTVCGAVYPSR